ncbi:hypothetical protein PybrP1_008370 [[Pythium] brassicae (nom. inval.)]|nr:hypothetical protein PybrP1_008370 [[Pythium] brassicae (nom. inval.)]
MIISTRTVHRLLLRVSISSPPLYYQQQRGFVSLLNVIPRATPSAPREHRAPPPTPLPAPRQLRLHHDNCSIEYVDLPPIRNGNQDSDIPRATIVVLHGAPGTYHDFRHLAPLLQQLGLRVLGVNLPGSGGSEADDKRYFEQISAVPSARLTLRALQELCTPDEKVFLMGHSFGAHTALNIAALNLDDSGVVDVKGLVLLAPAGCRPHRVLRPKETALAVDLLRSSNAVVARAMPLAAKLLYTKMLGFSSDFPASHYVAGIVRAGTTDFQVITNHVRATKASTPSFLAWSTRDEYMEEAIPEELAALCHPFGPRIAFTGGGHNIQKTRADVLAREVGVWIRDVLLCRDFEDEVRSPQIQVLPCCSSTPPPPKRQREALTHIPAFSALAKDDVHIEEEISLKVSKESHPGPRSTFDKGGHTVQKIRADKLAVELKLWVFGLISGGPRWSAIAGRPEGAVQCTSTGTSTTDKFLTALKLVQCCSRTVACTSTSTV